MILFNKFKVLLLVICLLLVPITAQGMHDHDTAREDRIMKASVLVLVGTSMAVLAFSGDTTALCYSAGATVCVGVKTLLDTVNREKLSPASVKRLEQTAFAIEMVGLSAYAAGLRGFLKTT